MLKKIFTSSKVNLLIRFNRKFVLILSVLSMACPIFAMESSKLTRSKKSESFSNSDSTEKKVTIAGVTLDFKKSEIVKSCFNRTEMGVEEFIAVQFQIQEIMDKKLRKVLKNLSPDQLKEFENALFNKLKNEEFNGADGIFNLIVIGNASLIYFFNSLDLNSGKIFFIVRDEFTESTNTVQIEQIKKSFLFNLGSLGLSHGRINLNSFSSCPIL